MKHTTNTLEGALLDAAVAMAEARPFILKTYEDGEVACIVSYSEREQYRRVGDFDTLFRPSTYWDDAGPIIARERIALIEMSEVWYAMLPNNSARGEHYIDAYYDSFDSDGPTPLIAAMRAYAMSKFGKDVELP